MTNCIGDYDSALKLLKKDSLSGMEIVKKKTHVTLPASYLGKVKEAIATLLNGELQSYSSKLDGIPIAYNRQNVKLLSRVGNILAAQSCVHFDVETDFIVFKPKIGSSLKGVVNKRSEHLIGCLVHGFFYASVKCSAEQSETINMGDAVLFKVVKLEEDGHGYLSITGSYESTMEKTAVLAEDDSGIDDHDSTLTPTVYSDKGPTDLDTGAAADSEVGSSQSAKKRKASAEDETQLDGEPSKKKTKKEKKKKREKKQKKGKKHKDGKEKKRKREKGEFHKDDNDDEAHQSVSPVDDVFRVAKTSYQTDAVAISKSENLEYWEQDALTVPPAPQITPSAPACEKEAKVKKLELDQMSQSEADTSVHSVSAGHIDVGGKVKKKKKHKKEKKSKLENVAKVDAPAVIPNSPPPENTGESFWVFTDRSTARAVQKDRSVVKEIPSLKKRHLEVLPSGAEKIASESDSFAGNKTADADTTLLAADHIGPGPKKSKKKKKKEAELIGEKASATDESHHVTLNNETTFSFDSKEVDRPQQVLERDLQDTEKRSRQSMNDEQRSKQGDSDATNLSECDELSSIDDAIDRVVKMSLMKTEAAEETRDSHVAVQRSAQVAIVKPEALDSGSLVDATIESVVRAAAANALPESAGDLHLAVGTSHDASKLVGKASAAPHVEDAQNVPKEKKKKKESKKPAEAPPAGGDQVSDTGSFDLFSAETPKKERVVEGALGSGNSGKRKLFNSADNLMTPKEVEPPQLPTLGTNEDMARYYLATLGLQLNADGSTAPMKKTKKSKKSKKKEKP